MAPFTYGNHMTTTHLHGKTVQPASLRVISYGGGVQSTALCVLATQGKLGHVDAALFSNVGDDSEHPATVTYVREVMIPWAKTHNLDIQELIRKRRDGHTETLYQRLIRPGSRSLPIPVRMPDTGAPGTRNCTADFKIKVIGRWLREHGAKKDRPATTLIGFSLDEIVRMSNKRVSPWDIPEYPLIDLRLTREDCKRIIERAGLPVPPKSACYFCPFHKPSTWARMRRDEPDLFEKSSQLETLLNKRRDVLGKDHVYLTRFGKPLKDAIHVEQDSLDFGGPGETCDEGYCWT
jgi:hypothetical protein